MASKTGWTRKTDNEACIDWLYEYESVWDTRRVTIRIDPAPERMTLAELKAAMVRGAEVGFSGGDPELVKQVGNCGTWDFVTDTDHYHFQDVRHFRYHLEAPWTEITHEKGIK